MLVTEAGLAEGLLGPHLLRLLRGVSLVPNRKVCGSLGFGLSCVWLVTSPWHMGPQGVFCLVSQLNPCSCITEMSVRHIMGTASNSKYSTRDAGPSTMELAREHTARTSSTQCVPGRHWG